MQTRCRQPPCAAYGIERATDGTATIILTEIVGMDAGEYVVEMYTLRGVPLREGLERSIRENYAAWMAAGAAVEHEIGIIRAAVQRAADEMRKDGAK